MRSCSCVHAVRVVWWVVMIGFENFRTAYTWCVLTCTQKGLGLDKRLKVTCQVSQLDSEKRSSI
jgi:hypothetical protein